MVTIDFGAVFPDSRGNRLQAFRFRGRRNGSTSYVLLRCCEDIVEQVLEFLAARNPERVPPVPPVAPEDSRVRWTDVIQFEGQPTTTLQEILELLTEVLTMRPVDELDLGLALDFYKVPPDGEEDDWTDTPTGALVRKKYWGRVAQREAGRTLADRLADVASTHPRYRQAEQVVAIPGTNHRFGERLAKGVAKRLDLPACTAVCEAPAHRPAKEGHETYELEPYSIPDSVWGNVVLLVDDVWRTGRTMRSVARAARDEGAVEVLGLVAARTMRNY